MSTKLRSNPLKSFGNCVKHELEEILSSLEHLLSLKEELGLVPAGTGRSNYSGVTPAERFRATPVVDESGFCGREDIKETIVQSLLSADVCDENIAVIPIIGAGGIGKTTLAQIIYHHPDVKKHFPEARAWVTVSTEFDLLTITKKIIGKVTTSPINGNEDQQELLFKLRDALERKRFLLVLDDVWSEDFDEWYILKSCFQSGEHGSKIIVTTRSAKVASIAAPNQPHHFLPELSQEDCWWLFAKTVFTGDQDRDAHPDLQEIGKKIVGKCKGLPLSVKSVGGILRGDRDVEKWENILKSSVWELLQENNKNIIPSLWLSYRYLPSVIKPCFAYCSIFPKDYRFKKEEVVQLWMAEGFLQNEAGKRRITIEKVGKRYFEELISRSLFQRLKEWHGGERFIMHDLVHDLAMNVSGEFCFCLDGGKNLRDLSCKTRYLSYEMENLDVKKFEGLSNAKRLHSFVGLCSFGGLGQSTEIGGDILKVLEELAMEGGSLRVLSLSSIDLMASLPDSIGNLKHLRYLNLSRTWVKKLPDSVGTLYNLQTLLLSECLFLTRLPSNLGRLINLHHLDTRRSGLKEMPPHMCNLTKLQTLSEFVVGKHGSSIRDLGALHDLSGELCISWLENVDDVLKGNLEDKKNLSKLVLEWGVRIIDSRESRKQNTVLDALQPHANLKELSISGYGGTSFPDWVLSSKIEGMYLDGCHNCLSLPSLGRLASLKKLRMYGFGQLETIGGDGLAMPSLEFLYFENMREWKRWSVIEVPRLKELTLKDCPKLVGGLPNSNTIRVLVIYKCESLDFPENHIYPSLENLKIEKSCGSIKRLSLENLPKLSQLTLNGLQCLVELTGESPDVLKRLSIEECPKLEFMGNGCYGSLKALKIRKCEALESIPLNNFPKLSELDLYELECPVELTGESLNELERLFIWECPGLEFMKNGCYGSLKALKIWKCEALKSVPLDYFPKLNELDLYELECLVELTGESPNELERLSIEESPALEFMGNGRYRSLKKKPQYLQKFESFPEGGLPAPNPEKFRSSECENLRSLPQQMHRLLPSLKRLKVMYSGEKELWPEGGLPSNLQSLRILRCKKVAAQVVHLASFPCLKSFKIDGCGEESLDSFPPEGLLHTSLTSLSISDFRGLKTLNIHAFQNLKELRISDCDELQCLPEESLPNSLVRLSIFRCPLLDRRYRKETGEGWHKISHIPVVYIQCCFEDQQT